MEQLNELESTIGMIIGQRQGRENAISRKDLVDTVQMYSMGQGSSDREIRKHIKHMIERHGWWIGSCSRGYFMIQTDEELLAACQYYHGYALSLLHVEAKLRKMSLAALVGQLSMEFQEMSLGH